MFHRLNFLLGIVTVVHGSNTSHKTVEVTAQASVTLKTPLRVTTTDGNGNKVITTPPLVTIMSTSTQPDGSMTTITQIVANPSENGAISSNSGYVILLFTV